MYGSVCLPIVISDRSEKSEYMFEVALFHPVHAKGHNHLIMAGFPRLTLATRVLLGAMVFIILVAAVAIHLIVDTGRRTYPQTAVQRNRLAAPSQYFCMVVQTSVIRSGTQPA